MKGGGIGEGERLKFEGLLAKDEKKTYIRSLRKRGGSSWIKNRTTMLRTNNDKKKKTARAWDRKRSLDKLCQRAGAIGEFQEGGRGGLLPQGGGIQQVYAAVNTECREEL